MVVCKPYALTVLSICDRSLHCNQACRDPRCTACIVLSFIQYRAMMQFCPVAPFSRPDAVDGFPTDPGRRFVVESALLAARLTFQTKL